MKFEASLLREKFVLRDQEDLKGTDSSSVTAVSNRMQLDLHGRNSESFVVRTQNMHLCVRLAMRIVQNFLRLGALMNRVEPHDWDQDWRIVLSDYEAVYNPDAWAIVYYEGKPIFSTGDHHPFLDMIEKCSEAHEGPYEETIPIAEKTFQATGKKIKIEYDSNVALVLDIDKNECRSGIIYRGPNRTTTFSFNATPLEGHTSVNIPQIMTGSAAFLEGIQLSYVIGMNNTKITMGVIERLSQEEKQTREAKHRLSRLGQEISNMEGANTIRYRPEKPNFTAITSEAETLALQIIDPKKKKPIPQPEEPEEEDPPIVDEDGKILQS